MARILLADDDASLLEVLGLAFTDAGHTVVTASDGARALDLAKRGSLDAKEDTRIDAIVSDVNMPQIDGFSLCRKLREAGTLVPIVLLTSRDNEIDEALGLELGADDYVAKPFSVRVLLARISALLRRDALRKKDASTTTPLRVGQLSLDAERLHAEYKSTAITLTLTEFRLLEALARSAGIVLSRDRLLEIVRGDESVVVERIIDTYVRRLRKKLEAIEPEFNGIETIIGAGYRWRA